MQIFMKLPWEPAVKCGRDRPAGSRMNFRAGAIVAELKVLRQAGTAFAAIASSSKAVEISRMLITPHRL
jgi:hypothetical protein